MSLLLETLRAVDGEIEGLEFHLQRMIQSRQTLWGLMDIPDLKGALEHSGVTCGPGIWKIRVLYDRVIRRIESTPYKPLSYNKIALVDDNSLEYSYKWADRFALNQLQNRANSAGADTALIVRNGLITDFLSANAVFFDGVNWLSPSKPLLRGTRRHRLLLSGKILTADIAVEDLCGFHCISPINAMVDLGEIRINPNLILNDMIGNM